jgi:carbamoyl-phosphate synthase large subunit
MDEVKMRSHAVIRGIPITTTIHGLRAAINGIQAMRDMKDIEVCSLQEFHRHSPKIKFPNLSGTLKSPRRKA